MNTNSALSASCCAGGGARSWLGGRTGLLLSASALGGAALWFGWPWLVVAGIAPILISIAPCLIMCGAMCAIGMCKKKSGSAAADGSSTVTAQSGAVQLASAHSESGTVHPVPGSVADTRTPA